MPNKKPTDNEIIKALKCMLGKYSVGEQMDCTGCAFETQALCSENASDGIVKAALYIINRLQAENSNLTSDLTSLKTDLTSAKAEIERLQKLYDGADTCIDELEYALDKVGHSNSRVDDALEDYRNLVKEMVGE